MRKFLLSGLFLCVAALCQAALPTVASVEKIALPGGMEASMATISPDGTYAVVSPLSGEGIFTYNFSTKKLTEVSAIGSGMQVEFTPDSRNFIYRESTYDNSHRRYVSLKSFDTVSGKLTTVVDRSRTLQGFATDGSNAVAIDGSKRRAARLQGTETPAAGRHTLSISYGNLCVTDANGNTAVIKPLGNECNSYLWPELSPDGKHIVAFGVGTGTFVCDLDGSNVKVLGMYRAPKWLDNNTIVAMDDYDNGVVTVKSTVMALSADAKEKAALTDESVVAVFPTAAGNKVAFTTPSGELYIINLK